MNTKQKGNRNEHRSIMLLESSGYACTRAAASLGVFDIVGISATDVCPPLCKKLLHRWRDRARLPDVRTV